MKREKINIIFVVDGPKLEAQACILAASIAKHFPKQVKTIAYHRKGYQPSPFMRKALHECNVTLREMVLPSNLKDEPWSQPWPIANKIYALSQPRDGDIAVAIDTDMFFRDYVDFAELLGGADIMAGTADYMSSGFGLDESENWVPIYGHFGLEVPSVRRKLLRGRRKSIPPYYNGGFYAFREGLIGERKERFGEARFNDCLAIDQAKILPEWKSLDQIMLPVTIERIGAKFKLAPTTINHNIRAHGMELYKTAKLVHYHQFSTLCTHHVQYGFEAFEAMEDVFSAEFIERFTEEYADELLWKQPQNQLARKLSQSADGTISSTKNNLTYLADKAGSDKGSSRHRYTELYQMLLTPYLNQEMNFLEMGLLGGWRDYDGDLTNRPTLDCPSIKMWLTFLKKAQIYGLDASDFSWFKDDRFTFLKCDLEDTKQIEAAALSLPTMDVIIDDASHVSHHQQNAFLEFFPKLRPGGLYIIEDLRRQPKQLERSKITKTGDLFYGYQVEGSFKHVDRNVQNRFNKLSDMIASCFVFQVDYRKDMPNQVAVIHRMP